MSTRHERCDDAGHPQGWKPAVRADRGKLARAERTAAGGVRIPGAIVTAGVLTYQHVDGSTVRELVPPEEVSNPTSLATLRDAPITVGHPAPDASGSQLVTPETYRELSVGHVSGEARGEGMDALADLVVLDGPTIARIDSGELAELSPGYRCFIDPTPGTWNGQPYDQVQRERTYNHVALLPLGGARGGSSVALRVDGTSIDFAVQIDAARQPTERTDSMEHERIDGVTYKVGSPEWREAIGRKVARLDEEVEKLSEEKKDAEEKLEKSDADKAALEAERDTLKTKLAEVEAKLAAATSEEATDARADARAALVAIYCRVHGADAQPERTDDKGAKKRLSDREIKLAVLAKLGRTVDPSKPDAYVDARFDSEVEHLNKQPSSALTNDLASLYTPPVQHVDNAGAPPPATSPHTAGRPAPTPIGSRYLRG